jgi:hypothetical protein
VKEEQFVSVVLSDDNHVTALTHWRLRFVEPQTIGGWTFGIFGCMINTKNNEHYI